MRRWEFIRLIGSTAVAWPLAARAAAAMPVIGFLGSSSPDLYSTRLRMFCGGLKEVGYVEGQSVAIEYRWAEGDTDRLPALAAELVQHRASLWRAAARLGRWEPLVARAQQGQRMRRV